MEACMTSLDGLEKSITLANGLCIFLKFEGFLLTEWKLNNSESLRALPFDERIFDFRCLNVGIMSAVRKPDPLPKADDILEYQTPATGPFVTVS